MKIFWEIKHSLKALTHGIALLDYYFSIAAVSVVSHIECSIRFLGSIAWNYRLSQCAS